MPTKFFSTRYSFGLLLMALALAACAKRTPAPAIAFTSPTAITGATRTAVPMVTRTLSPTPTPTITPNLATQIHLRVTYVPSHTPSPTATRGTPTATFLPTSTFAPWLTPATPLGLEAYRLKQWTAEDALAAVAEADGILNEWIYWYPARRYQIDVEQEASLRFPEMAYQANLYWKIGLYGSDVYFQNDANYLTDYFLPALKAKLNSGELKDCNFSQRYLEVVSYAVENLFGDKQPTYVCGIAYNGFSVAFVAIKENPIGEYEVIPLQDHWVYNHISFEGVSVADHNGNGQSEIQIIDDGLRWFRCGIRLSLYEWQGTYPEGRFVNIAKNMSPNAQEPEDTCNTWEFGPPDSTGAQSIISVQPYYLGYGTTCLNGSQKTVYVWTGETYELAPQQPALPDRPISTTSALCKLTWADKTGWQDEEAVKVLETTLEQWPREMNREWGLASQDYFLFKLGTWYAQRGKKNLAQQTLEHVRDHPSAPQHTTASAMARVYLQNYQANRLVAACRASVQVLERLPFDAKAKWGFSAPYWDYEATNICNPRETFRTAIQSLRPHTNIELYDWFREQQIPVWTIAQGDINNDGTRDWVVLVETSENQYWDLWALLHTPTGLDAVLVEPGYWYGQPTANYFATLTQTVAEGMPLNAFELGKRATSFRLVMKDGQWQAVDVSSVTNYGPLSNTSAQSESLAKIEKALFERGDYATAQTELLSLLAKDIIEYHYDYPSVDTPPVIRPRLLYLLGLTYELSGDEANAVQTYWQLWRDYPDNPYTFIARRKLELKP